MRAIFLKLPILLIRPVKRQFLLRKGLARRLHEIFADVIAQLAQHARRELTEKHTDGGHHVPAFHNRLVDKVLLFDKRKRLCHLHEVSRREVLTLQNFCLGQQQRCGGDCRKQSFCLPSLPQKVNQLVVVEGWQRIDRSRQNHARIVGHMRLLHRLGRDNAKSLLALNRLPFAREHFELFSEPNRKAGCQAGNLLQ